MKKIVIYFIILFFPILLSVPFEDDIQPIVYQELEKEKQCISDALWHEARGETLIGIKSVLSVIQNRKNSPKFPDSYCKVIHQPGQFSYIIHGKALKRSSKPSEIKVKGLIDTLAHEAVYGGFKNSFDNPDVLYYHTNQVRPKWSRKMQKVADLGKHQFFK